MFAGLAPGVRSDMAPGLVAGSPAATATAAFGRSGPDMQEIRPRIWLGSYGAACDSTALAERGVTHILTVGVNTDLLGVRQRVQLPPSEKDPLTRLIVAVQDASHARLDRHFDACSSFMADALAKGGAVLVHCQAGQSRSPTIVAAYLMREERLEAFEALESIKQIRSVIRPNCGFLDQLRALELRLNITTAARPEENAEVEASIAPPGPPSVRQVDDVFGTEDLRLRSEKLRAKYQQVRNIASLLALAAPLRKRRLMGRRVGDQVMR